MIEPGRLRHRVKVKKPTPAASGYGKGAAKPVYNVVAERWAEVRPLRASEKVRAQQPGMETAYVVTMRFDPIVTPDCQLEWEGHTLHIDGITDVDGRHAVLEVLCNEREAPNGA